MFDPNNRSLLTDQLQPPRGFQLKFAIGTTFTLDLSTALSVPLAFASHRFAQHDDLGIIATLSQLADRVTIFTQAGEIRPGIRSDLVALLEEVIVPVHPKRGVFHPKVWLLEYVSGEKREYRFLGLSRNLTEDRSWDLTVRLDGVPAREEERPDARERNEPLVGLVDQLCVLGQASLDGSRLAEIREFSRRLAEVTWELPPGVEDVKFHHLGSSGISDAVANMFDFPAREALIVSPFLSPEGVKTAGANVRRPLQVISRPEAFDQLPEETAARLGETYVLHDTLFYGDGETAGTGDDEFGETSLSGLHAKAVFMRNLHRQSSARALIGSANITAGGLRNNIEMMVQFDGHIRHLGPSAVLDRLAPMLETYASGGGHDSDPVEQARMALEARLRSLASGVMHARVRGSDPFALSAWAEPESAGILEALREDSVDVTWSPYGMTGRGEPFHSGEEHATEHVGLRQNEVSPFLRLTATQHDVGSRVTASSIVIAQLHDDIPKRRDAILTSSIHDSDQFLKLLMLLLNPENSGLDHVMEGSGEGGNWNAALMRRGLFETLLKSLATGDEGLDVADRFFRQIAEGQSSSVELSPELIELWKNARAARRSRIRGSQA